MKTLFAWTKASRLQSQSYIFLPILFGQACHYFQGNEINWTILVLMHLFGLFDQLYIVYANDFADRDTDSRNTTYNIFSGGSRVLVDKNLSPGQLGRGAILMAALCLACGVVLTAAYHRWLAVPGVGIALVLLWMYSYRPVALNYRGGGEFLQMLGVGMVLPVLSYYSQAGQVIGFPWPVLAAVLPTQLACAMGTSLPDEPSDRFFHKRTASVLLGSQPTKALVVGLNLASIACLPWVMPAGSTDSTIGAVMAIPLAATILHLFFIKSPPGTLKLTVLNFLTVLATLSIMAGLSVAFFIA
ncbi:MAG: prenyltransferase [Proteobacteria bacterium]|nr:prenyltransferase [Pseudomonadota bacterium]